MAIRVIIIVDHLMRGRQLYHLLWFLHRRVKSMLHYREDCGNTPVDHISEQRNAFSCIFKGHLSVLPCLRNVHFFQKPSLSNIRCLHFVLIFCERSMSKLSIKANKDCILQSFPAGIDPFVDYETTLCLFVCLLVCLLGCLQCIKMVTLG